VTYNVIPTPKFEDDMEFYIKKKKFLHIDDDLDAIISQLECGIFMGDPIADIDAHNKTYKVRAANSDTGMGKSNGYRVIYYAVTQDLEIYLLTVYYKKGDHRIPSDNEIKDIIQQYCL
jgi:mRNA-degrading endonuclease RelE of RelBE toxin-antitoxin system